MCGVYTKTKENTMVWKEHPLRYRDKTIFAEWTKILPQASRGQYVTQPPVAMTSLTRGSWWAESTNDLQEVLRAAHDTSVSISRSPGQQERTRERENETELIAYGTKNEVERIV